MTDRSTTPSQPTAAPERADAAADARPAYERPRVVKRKAVTRATLFTGGGGPSSAPPLTSQG